MSPIRAHLHWPPLQLAQLVLLGLVIQIPFELRYTAFGLSNLQWTFIILLLLSLPSLVPKWKSLLRDRLVLAAVLFVAVQWLAAMLAPEFQTNAVKAAVRFTAGLVLLVIAKHLAPPRLFNIWVIVSVAAAAYALADYAGLVSLRLFRTEEFYIGQVQRLSGSFEYPNTAAAYFAMSLFMVWRSSFRASLRVAFAFLVWCAVVLTFSKGALLAVPVMALLTRRISETAGLVATGVSAYVVLLPLNPYLIDRVMRPAEQKPLSVEYRTEWNYLQQQPRVNDTVSLEIRNTGITRVLAAGRLKSAVSYRWWNADTERFVAVDPIVTQLPRDIHAGETVQLEARFQTPANPGRYLLVLELFSSKFDWFSRTGVIPLLIEADIQPEVSRKAGDTDLSWAHERGKKEPALTASVTRLSLWRAALKIAADHPLGIGPDNYRLLYGKYLGAKVWDTQIYANNLYLELLAGSGILGLSTFLLVMTLRRWNTAPESLAVGVFLIHGIVDVFLMATPIYFAFWLLTGIEQRDAMHRPASVSSPVKQLNGHRTATG